MSNQSKTLKNLIMSYNQVYQAYGFTTFKSEYLRKSVPSKLFIYFNISLKYACELGIIKRISRGEYTFIKTPVNNDIENMYNKIKKNDKIRREENKLKKSTNIEVDTTQATIDYNQHEIFAHTMQEAIDKFKALGCKILKPTYTEL
jgi:hypothetical protein